jgi:hypothetical protein
MEHAPHHASTFRGETTHPCLPAHPEAGRLPAARESLDAGLAIHQFNQSVRIDGHNPSILRNNRKKPADSMISRAPAPE